MSEEDLELLVTMDDPGEDTLEEDTFHHPTEKASIMRRRNNPQTVANVDSDDSE